MIPSHRHDLLLLISCLPSLSRLHLCYSMADYHKLQETCHHYQSDQFCKQHPELDIPTPCDNTSPLSDVIRSQFHKVLAQLNWLAGISRPLISFYSCSLAPKLKTCLDKVVPKVQHESFYITFLLLTFTLSILGSV